MSVSGAVSSKTGQWVYLCNEDSSEGRYASKGPSWLTISQMHASNQSIALIIFFFLLLDRACSGRERYPRKG